MTIAVVCTLSDGLVFGADSAVTIQGSIQNRLMNVQGVLKVYNDAEKLFQLAAYPIGVVTYGVGTMNQRGMESYVREFELRYLKDRDEKRSTVEALAKDFYEFIHKEYTAFFEPAFQAEQRELKTVPGEQRPPLGFMIGGYSPKQHLPELWEVLAQFDDPAMAVKLVRPRGQFGANWQGFFSGVTRFMKGFEPGAINDLVAFFVEQKGAQLADADKTALTTLLAPYEYVIPFDAMPLQEGIDYVAFLVGIMVNQTRFVVGAPVCGGNIRLGVVRRSGFQFVSETPLRLPRA